MLIFDEWIEVYFNDKVVEREFGNEVDRRRKRIWLVVNKEICVLKWVLCEIIFIEGVLFIVMKMKMNF